VPGDADQWYAHVDDRSDDVTRRLVFETAMRRLPPRQRAVLVYRYYHGLDVAATADALGCTPGTVKSQTARGLANLRDVLGDVGLEPEPLIRNPLTSEVTP